MNELEIFSMTNSNVYISNLNPISCIRYRLEVSVFMNRPILVLFAREIMKCPNTYVLSVYIAMHFKSFPLHKVLLETKNLYSFS